jgi:hypothetical protein
MGSRRKRQKESHKATHSIRQDTSLNQGLVWSSEDVAHVLAWLDYCRDHGSIFRDTAVAYLQSTGRYFTWNAVRRKLDRIWVKFHGQGANSLELFASGTGSLRDVSDGVASKILEIKQALEAKSKEGENASRCTPTNDRHILPLVEETESGSGLPSSLSLLSRSPSPPYSSPTPLRRFSTALPRTRSTKVRYGREARRRARREPVSVLL